jgi:hypothetical protein
MFMRNEKSFTEAQAARILSDLMPTGSAADMAARLTGLAAGSLVETDTGWRPVEAVAAGMCVGTWDGGMQPVLSVATRTLWPAPGLSMVHVPGGALGNCAELWLPADQRVLIESAHAEAVLGRAAVLVAARHLAGHRGIRLGAVTRPLTLHALRFGRDEMVFVNTGLVVACAGLVETAADDFFPELTAGQAQALCELAAAQNAGVFSDAA